MSDLLPPLFHYSAEPLGELKPVIQVEPPHVSFAYKPRGLWLSVGDEWEEWCRDNEVGLDRLKVRHAVVVKKPERILWLKTPDDILRFQKTFAKSDGITSYPAIDWVAVAERHAGILIAPYQWSLRLDLMWYYGWDCASGCIWNTAIIETLDRKGDLVTSCDHDLLHPDNTMTVYHDLREGMEYQSIARCRICKASFRHPLYRDRSGEHE